MIMLLVNTPVSIADSGQRSRISKTKGNLLNLDNITAVIPTKRGGEVTKIISKSPLTLNNPA